MNFFISKQLSAFKHYQMLNMPIRMQFCCLKMSKLRTTQMEIDLSALAQMKRLQF